MNRSVLRRLELLDTESRRERIKGQKSSGADANINITPLVDVVLVLLIIFMVVTPMINDGLKLPFAKNPDHVNAQMNDLKIVLKASGELKVGDKVVADSGLEQALTQELGENATRSVYIYADKAIQFAKVRHLLSTLRDRGIAQAGLISSITHDEEEK